LPVCLCVLTTSECCVCVSQNPSFETVHKFHWWIHSHGIPFYYLWCWMLGVNCSVLCWCRAIVLPALLIWLNQSWVNQYVNYSWLHESKWAISLFRFLADQDASLSSMMRHLYGVWCVRTCVQKGNQGPKYVPFFCTFQMRKCLSFWRWPSCGMWCIVW
jgi:hypothetical protein